MIMLIVVGVHVITMLALAFRIMLFGSRSRRRPVIAALAYVIMSAAFIAAIQSIFQVAPPPTVLVLALEIALTIAAYCHGGNVAHLFKSKTNCSKLSQLLFWSPSREKKT